MKYMQCSIGLPLILSIDKSENIKWYVDVAFVAHTDIRSHTGGLMSMSTGGVYVQSRKQKLNTNSSTESNIDGVDNVLTQVVYTHYLRKEQVYEIHYNIIYQDN